MLQWVGNTLKKISRTASNRNFLMLAVFVLTFFVLIPAHATSNSLGGDIAANNQVFGDQLGLATEDIRVIIAKIIRIALGFVGIVLVVIIMYAGFLWMTAQGNDERIAQAKKIIINATVGLAVILSSYAITSFIISKLLQGVNGNGVGTNRVSIATADQSFFGSGALGTVIRDHYPGRNQQDVPRNSKIILTFRRAIVPASLINDSNNNGIFGDCVGAGTPSFVWETSCDQLKLDSNFISFSPSGSGASLPRGATALVSPEVGGVFTVVIRPFDALGSDSEKILYTVRVGKGIRFDDPTNNNPSIFEGKATGSDFYEWSFTCDTILDTVPPHVQSVFPANSANEGRNSIIQINFDKPMDPSTLQGTFSAGAGYYVLKGNSVFLKTANSTLPAGNFRLVNNYKTAEFAPTSVCGQNACGRTVYCMPVCDRAGATCDTDSFEVLLRSAQTFDSKSFDAVPFSGLMDISGNALDGNQNGTVDAVARTGTVFPGEATGDNYYWKYDLNGTLDLTSPYLTQVQPGINATFVGADDILSLTFSKRMRAESLYNIIIDEQPISAEPLCYVPRAFFSADGGTLVRIEHCPFLTVARHYYYPIVDSTVEDTHFNCFYPGFGPTGLNPTTKASTICDSQNPANCCSVVPGSSPLCCNGLPSNVDRTTCLNSLKATSP